MAGEPSEPTAEIEHAADVDADAVEGRTEAESTIDDRQRARWWTALLLGVVSVVLLHAGVIGAWTTRTALDSDRFENQVAEILRAEEVSGALATFVVTEVGESIDLRTPLVEVSPESVEPLIDVLLAGVEARLVDLAAQLIQSDEVSSTVAAAAGRAHELSVDVLEGRSISDRVIIDDGQVRINLVPLVARVLELLPDIGLLSEAEIPQFEPGGDPAAQIAALEAALDVELAEDFAQPTIFASDTLAELGDTVDLARSVLTLAKQVLWILLLLGVACGVLSLWFSRNRLRSGAFLVGGIVVLTLLTRWTTGSIADRIPDAVVNPGARATVREVVLGLDRDLSRALFVYSLLAIVALGVAVAVTRWWPPEEPSDEQVDGAAEPADADGDTPVTV